MTRPEKTKEKIVTKHFLIFLFSFLSMRVCVRFVVLCHYGSLHTCARNNIYNLYSVFRFPYSFAMLPITKSNYLIILKILSNTIQHKSEGGVRSWDGRPR